MKPCSRCGRDHGRRSGCMIPRPPDSDPGDYCAVCATDIRHELGRREVKWPGYVVDLCGACPIPPWEGRPDLLARPQDELSTAPKSHVREGYCDISYNIWR